MSRVEVVELRKAFGRVEALKGVSMQFDDGEMIALLGPSGCGKSTTLFILAGLYQPTSGHVRFDGKEMAGVHPKDRNIGLVFQSYALYPNMTVRQNIAFPLKLQKRPAGEIDRRVAEVAAFTQLTPLLERKPSELSGGQQQRVAAARAIVKRPALLLLDEPLSNLDVELRAGMRREIKRIQRETNITTVIVTHDQGEAMSLADRIFVMSDGRVQQVGDHRALYERPATRFVAGFIGTPSMNFVAAPTMSTLEGARPEAWLYSERTRLLRIDPGPLRRVLDGGDEQSFVLGVRPEHVVLSPDASSGVAARVSDVVPEGREAVVTLEMNELRLRSIVPSTREVAVGQTVGVSIDERFVHLFDASTGEAAFHGSYGRASHPPTD